MAKHLISSSPVKPGVIEEGIMSEVYEQESHAEQAMEIQRYLGLDRMPQD